MGFWIVIKPLVFVWAGLNVLDDLSIAMRLIRLGTIAVPGLIGSSPGEDELCDLCDDVMGDILLQEGVSVLPCSLLCLKLPKCMEMCDHIKDASATSSKYPCVAAGYCSAEDEGYAEDIDFECSVGKFFSCQPKKFCHRKRRNLFKFSCELRPGIGRWIAIKDSVASHAGAVMDGLLSQPHCGEANAGPYCIAEPKGHGAIAEIVGYLLSLLYGGYKSIQAIESPGGDDDQQWLTFWLILGITLFLERFLARVLLSTFPMYYECKLTIIIWLQFFNGAQIIYRKIRKKLNFIYNNRHNTVLVSPNNEVAIKELHILEDIGGKTLIQNRLLKEINNKRQSTTKIKVETILSDDDDYGTTTTTNTNNEDYEWDNNSDNTENDNDATERTRQLCDFLVSKEGIRTIENCNTISEESKRDLLERAHIYNSFQPQYLYVKLIGVQDSKAGELPPTDSNGYTDPYVTCKIVMSSSSSSNDNNNTAEMDVDDKTTKQPWYHRRRGEKEKKNKKRREYAVSSSTICRTLWPQWNEMLELPLSGGYIDVDGSYRNNTINTSALQVEVWDADIGFWSSILRILPIGGTCLGLARIAFYVLGLSDQFTPRQWHIIQLTYYISLVVFVVAYIMANIFRADDEPIGQCIVPLSILMDRGEHSLLLKLREMTKENDTTSTTTSTTLTTIRNSVGGLGILRVKLALSEN